MNLPTTTFRPALASALLALLFAPLAKAQCTLVGVASDTPSSTTTTRLWDIDQTNGAATNPRVVSTAPNRSVTAIAFSPSGTLYGVSAGQPSDVPSSGKLYTIALSGTATLVGTMTQFIHTEGDIAFDPTTGLLYAVDGVGALFRIDTTNASCAAVGNLPLDLPGGADYSGLAFDSTGQLFVWSTFGQVVRKVNKTNGQIQSTVSLSSSAGGAIGGMAFDPASGIAYIAGGSGGAAQLSSVDTTSGTRTAIGPLTGMNGVWGISFDTGSCTMATVSNYGVGCIACQDSESFHELFPAAAGFDLGNAALTMVPTATGYVVVPGGVFVPPSGAATALPLGDDSQVTVALPFPFPYCGSSTSSLTVCSNGFVSVAPGNGTGFVPSVAALLQAPQTAWWSWHDFNPAAPGSGPVKFEVVGTIAYVTWDGVLDFGHTTPNTFQFQFDLATGQVTYAYQAMSGLGNAHAVGYSRGGPSPNHGDTDLSALTAKSLCCVEIDPLRLDVPQRPVAGLANIPFVTSNIPAGTVLLFVGYDVVKFDPGLPLFGSPGCSIYHPWTVWQWLAATPPTQTITPFFLLPVVPAAIGFRFYAQSMALGVPGVPGGWLWSNGVELVIGQY